MNSDVLSALGRSAPRVLARYGPDRPPHEGPLAADRLRELAAEFAASGGVQTAAIARALADEVEGAITPPLG